MVVSAEFVALQVKQVIQRREQWLRDNSLPFDSIMNEDQKDAFLDEVKAEYHGSPDQQQRQEADKAAGKTPQKGKHQRWSRECQRRGGTTQMFHLLSFSGRWDASFFDKSPVPQQVGEEIQHQKKKTRAAVEARARLRLARKYDRLRQNSRRAAETPAAGAASNTPWHCKRCGHWNSTVEKVCENEKCSYGLHICQVPRYFIWQCDSSACGWKNVPSNTRCGDRGPQGCGQLLPKPSLKLSPSKRQKLDDEPLKRYWGAF